MLLKMNTVQTSKLTLLAVLTMLGNVQCSQQPYMNMSCIYRYDKVNMRFHIPEKWRENLTLVNPTIKVYRSTSANDDDLKWQLWPPEECYWYDSYYTCSVSVDPDLLTRQNLKLLVSFQSDIYSQNITHFRNTVLPLDKFHNGDRVWDWSWQEVFYCFRDHDVKHLVVYSDCKNISFTWLLHSYTATLFQYNIKQHVELHNTRTDQIHTFDEKKQDNFYTYTLKDVQPCSSTPYNACVALTYLDYTKQTFRKCKLVSKTQCECSKNTANKQKTGVIITLGALASMFLLIIFIQCYCWQRHQQEKYSVRSNSCRKGVGDNNDEESPIRPLEQDVLFDRQYWQRYQQIGPAEEYSGYLTLETVVSCSSN